MIDYGKRYLLGVMVDAVDIDTAVDRLMHFARTRRPCSMAALATHGVMLASWDEALAGALNDFDLVVPDGQPVRWALNLLYGLDLPDKVPGPDVVERLLEHAADEGLAVHFYGSTPDTLARIERVLRSRFGGRIVVSSAPSLFRAVGLDDINAIAQSINATGAQLCFVGLGCPRQERFVSSVAPQLAMPALAVGAAFDYLGGSIRRAPLAVRRAGLEWLYRTYQDPRRLAGRYAETNGAFLVGVCRQLIRQKLNASPPVPTAERPRLDRLDA